jgi:4-amino-4-deoxy-L-arabinose transferase-like glycosyltransferase
VPPFEAPDEPAHLAYVVSVATRAELPNQVDPERALTGYGPVPTEGHQPPLYYALAAAVLRLTAGGAPAGVDATPVPNPEHAWNGGGRVDLPLFEHPAGPRAAARPFRLLRLLSVACGVLTVGVVLALSARLFAGRWALVPAVVVATLPQYLFVSATISNDALTGLLVTLCLLFALTLLQGRGRGRDYLLLGVCLGLALLTKKTALFLLPGLALLLGYAALARPSGGQRARAAAWTLALLGTLALLCGWYFLRSQALYGDPLGTEMEKATLGALVQEKTLDSPYFGGPFRQEMWESFFGKFGWMQVALPRGVYWFYAALLVAGGLGALVAVFARRFPVLPALFAAGFVLSCFGGIVVYNLTYSQPQGRFLFPVLSLVAILLTAGLRELLGRLPLPALRATLLLALVAGLVLVDAIALQTLWEFYRRAGLFA